MSPRLLTFLAVALVSIHAGAEAIPEGLVHPILIFDRDGATWVLSPAQIHAPIGDCDDTDPNVYPGAPEIADNNIDDNCNGLADEAADGTPSDNPIDNDSDGVSLASGDCNDLKPSVHPGAAEIIGDLIDNNCNGLADEDALGNPSLDTEDHDGDRLPMSNDVIFSGDMEL